VSAEATGHVFRHSPHSGATFLVHLAIADSVNDQHGNELWMSTSTIAKKARVARQTASEALATIEAAGGLEVVEDHRHDRAGKPSRYRFLFPTATVYYESRGVTRDDTPAKEVSPETTPASGGVSPVATRGVTRDDTNPREPKVLTLGAEQARPTKRAHQLPDSWQPTEQHYRMATERGLSVEGEAEQFEDYHRAKGSTMKDWDRAFNTWLRNASKFAGRGLRAVDDPRYSDDPAIRAQAYGTTITDRSRPAWMDAKDA